MNTEFKFQVAGPYQPIIAVEPDECFTGGFTQPKVATAETALELFQIYHSILTWRGHDESMAQSMRHAQTMLGEIDEPDETPRQQGNPLFVAGMFALGLVSEYVGRVLCDPESRPEPEQFPRGDRVCVEAAIVQALFALLNDDDALACYARYIRTGFLGGPSAGDIARVEDVRKFVRRIVCRADQIYEAFESWVFYLPLQTRYCYDSESRQLYWSDPILIPEIGRDDDC